MKLTRIAIAIASTFGVIGLIGMTSAFADDNTDQAGEAPQKVVVTGSALKRIAGETSLPVQIITKQDIDRSGATTALELLNTISAASSSGNTNPASSMFSGTVMSGASLRGMGYQRTLVLLNGRRVANNAFDGGGVDLETIPLTAIDRVEVLMDGASAVYGADAVGGVINFILVKDFQGVEGTIYGTDTQHGGASGQRATFTAGKGDLVNDHYNAFITMDLRQDNPLASADRPFSSTALMPPIYGSGRTYYLGAYPFPGNAYTYGPSGQNYAVTNPGSPNCTAPKLTAAGDGSCLYDGAASGDILPLDDKFSAVSKITFKTDNATEYFIETSFSRNSYTLPTTPTFAQGESTAPDGTFPGYVPFQIFPNSPYYPAAFASQNGMSGQPIDFVSLLTELGPTVTKTTNQQERLVLGTTGTVWGWDYDTAINLNRANSVEHYLKAIIDTQAFYNLTLSGLYNPFGPQSPAGLAALQATQWSGESRNAVAMTKSWDLKLTKSLFELPAGTVDVAMGAELRNESLSQTYGIPYADGYLLNFGGAGAPANPAPRTIKSLSAEANIPIIKNLEADVSVRDDDYSSFGNTVNPKVSFRWQPVETLMFRGSWGTGFRAPNLVDIATPTTYFAGTPFSDPVRCPGGVPVAGANPSYDCNDPFMQAHYGNPNLKPEKSVQSTIGVVYEPIKQLTVGVNYFHINLTNVIQTMGLPPNLAFDPATAAQYASMLVRGPVDPNAPNLPGPIQYINVPSLNEGGWNVKGADLNAEYRFPATSFGKFALKMDGTYYQTFDISMVGQPTIGTVGQKNQLGEGVLNRWHHYLTLNWVKDAWDVTFAQSFWSGYQDENPYAFFGTNLPGYPRVASYSLFDLTAQYKATENLTMNGGIKNLFDRYPPYTNNIEAVGFDPAYADPRGRAFWVSATYAFK
jgi:iron complex outermembrane receptor protein